MKFILLYLSEFLFRKIGYGAMVVSGIMLLVSTMQTIIQQDRISVTENRSEATVRWRESSFVMEYSYNDGIEIERPITNDELPENLKVKYAALLPAYDQILLEKVFTFSDEPSYEFYCFKNKVLTKFEF